MTSESASSDPRPVLLPECDNFTKPSVPSANIKPINAATGISIVSKIPPLRSRLPTPRTASVSDSNNVSISTPRPCGAYGFPSVGAADVFLNNDQENENPLSPATNNVKKRKILEFTNTGPSAKMAKPGNLQVELLKTKKKAARRSINNALKITRNKAAKEAALTKTSSNVTAKVRPAPTKKPLPSVNNRKPVGTASTRTVSRVSTVTKATTSTSVKPKPAARNSSINATGRGQSSCGGNINTNQKKPKRKPWDLKGQLEDLKEELSTAKEKDSMIADILTRLNALECEKTNITLEKTALGSDVQSLQMKLQDSEDNLHRLKSKYENLERHSLIEKEDLMNQLRSVRNVRDELDIEVHKLKRELSESKEQKLAVMKEKESSLLDLTAKMKENEQLDAELREAKSTIIKLENEVRENEADRRQLLNTVQELKGNIRVFCRVRPMLPNEEKEFGAMDHIEFSGNNKSLVIKNESNKPFSYSFDKVFDVKTTQEFVFNEVSQLIESALDGYNVSIFAYGQTGAGKTYTMEGPDKADEDEVGIIPRAMRLIFQKCEEKKKFDWTYNLAIQHVEIYRETLQDLLQNKDSKLEIKTVARGGKQRVWVKNLSLHPITNFNQVRRLLEQSKSKRATAATNANERSSRSHSVFILKIEAKNDLTGEEIESSLNLIDLAGSERVAETGSSGTRLKEAQKINTSLMELSNVISALANKDSHVPYRNSKLTFLLMDSLGGNSKTLMVVNVNPVKRATSETINTLRFATTVNKCNIGTAQKAVKFN